MADPAERDDVETGVGHDLPEKPNAEGEDDQKPVLERKITGIKVAYTSCLWLPNIDFFV